MQLEMHIMKAKYVLTYPIFFFVEDNNLMDWRRRNDSRDSNIPRSFITSSLLRLEVESPSAVFPPLLVSSFI